jgi:hypothetical protein
MNKKPFIFLFISLFLFLQAGCNAATPTTAASMPKGFQSRAETMSENIISGLNKQDYAAFSKDFDQKMISAIPSTAMGEVRKLLWNQFGEYRSIQTKKFFEEKGYFIGLFNVVFEKGSMDMQVVFSQIEPYKVSSLWFPTK